MAAGWRNLLKPVAAADWQSVRQTGVLLLKTGFDASANERCRLVTIKERNLWLIAVVLAAFSAGFLSKFTESPVLQVLGLLLAVGAIALYAWPSKKLWISPNHKSQPSEDRKVIEAKRALRAEARLSAARDAVSAYRPLVDGISDALGIDPEASWENFSAAFPKRGCLGDGLDAAYGKHPLFACFDWKDTTGLDEFAERVRNTLHPDEQLTLQKDVSVDVGLKDLDGWLRARGSLVLTIDIGSDSYHCLGLKQGDVPALLDVQTPEGITLATLTDD